MPVIPFIPAIAAGVGAVATNVASNRAKGSAQAATNVANAAATRSDELEQAKFEEAKRQAEILRQRGDEAAAVAMEEAARAELGAEKFENLSNQYAQRAEAGAKGFQDLSNQYATKADEAAKLNEQRAFSAYGKIDRATLARQQAGQKAQQSVLDAAQGVQDSASQNERRLNASLGQSTGYLDKAFGNISDRYSPFIDSERRARGQLDAELGLAPGEVNKTYQNSPAYLAAQDASRVAEQEGIQTINQAAGNSGTLYSGTRGAALADRSKAGSYERAGIEQNYYQNYMNMLQGMANPASTNALAGYESANAGNKAGLTMDTASRIGSANMDAAGTGVNATLAANQLGLDSMASGAEGLDLMAFLNPGTAGANYALAGYDNGMAGANYALGGVNQGTAGSQYRLGAQDYRIQGAGGAGSAILGNMPTGDSGAAYRLAGANSQMQGAEAQNAALSDLIGGGTNLLSAYLQYGRGSPSNTGRAYAQPAYLPYTNSNTRLA